MLKLTIIASLGVLLHAHDERLKDENGNYIGRGCGTEEYNEELLAQDPEWQKSLDEFETMWAERSAAIQAGTYKSEMEEPMMISIPIVNHVMVPTSSPTPPSSALASQMQTLVDDYSAQNSDYTSGTPVEFRGVRSGNFGYSISQDPATEFKSTSTSSFSSNNNIKFSNSGGSNVISPSSKLNQWFGVLSGGLLGYAQFPGGNSATDGVVNGIGTMSPAAGGPPYNLGRTATHEIGHWLNLDIFGEIIQDVQIQYLSVDGVVNGIGTMSPAAGGPPYNLGRTATHEIGHWLNLRHIWGDNTGCTNTVSISDFVTDTPPSSSSNFGCPSGVKRCSANPYTQDMYMNYMDYVEDACMVMFTQLQKARADASIQQYRGGFTPTSATTTGPSDIGYKTAEVEYINWVYFKKFEGDEPSDDEKCYDAFTLYYDDDLNEGSDSNIHIYGCMQKTKYMNVGHITDIYFTDNECAEGDKRDNQNLNEGNEGDEIYLCYSHAESTDNYDGLLDITFIKDDDTSKLDESWTINTAKNINPNGIKLNFAMKKGTFYHDEDATIQSAGPQTPIDTFTHSEATQYIGIGVGLALLALALIGAVICRHNYSKKKAMTAYVNEALANEYGATTELTKVNI
eukprot:CAMPEP_0201594468 /NCGR_PEP_ID=MMETSP0190_2-20130828/191774_1 /ASSEMBLY_ACC=CAM_ASM_000263 /TAXON_ID=37353 /ORGANISM="Rosalina sp." /LENGTH=624 /DNA_ID=CAMNT_0048054093 /DNA_START=66 /DNA_END=1941 /DNA_ORIENTATION=+